MLWNTTCCRRSSLTWQSGDCGDLWRRQQTELQEPSDVQSDDCGDSQMRQQMLSQEISDGDSWIGNGPSIKSGNTRCVARQMLSWGFSDGDSHPGNTCCRAQRVVAGDLRHSQVTVEAPGLACGHPDCDTHCRSSGRQCPLTQSGDCGDFKVVRKPFRQLVLQNVTRLRMSLETSDEAMHHRGRHLLQPEWAVTTWRRSLHQGRSPRRQCVP